MTSLFDLTEQLAAAVIGADIGDLVTLAAIYDHLEAIGRSAGETLSDRQSAAAIQSLTGSTAGLVQRIVLDEVDSADVSLRQVSQSAAELQQMIELALDGKPIAARGATAAAAIAPADESGAIPAHSQIVETPCNPDDKSLVIEFITEAGSHIDSAEAELLKLDEEPDNLESVNAIFRSFHTIKGVAGFLNLAQIGKLAHAAEGLLDRARHGQLQLAGAALDLVLESVDAMKRLVGLLEQAAKAGQVMAIWPPLVSLIDRLHRFVQGGDVALAGQSPAAGATARRVAAGGSATAATKSASSPLAATATTGTVATAAGAAHAGQPRGSAESTTAAPAAPATAPAISPLVLPASAEPIKPAAAEQTVKVATDRLDALINHVGELVIAHSMVSQDIARAAAESPRLAGNLAHLGKIARELQELSMSMRMVPIAGVFQKMSRLVRDVARKTGREIELVLVGKETELDRNVVEAIGDPLVHMIRNACDHGIESPEERVKKGKPRQGRIELKASHQSGNIVIEISDDGKGLDAARILKKAIENGIVPAHHSLSEAEIFKLIFAAGLSTAEKVTDLSGRGVGMDVVKKNIESLRGRVEIASTPGRGSTFTIRLPLTLAVIDGLIVRVGAQRYILPLLSVEQSIRPSAEQLSSVNGRGEMCMVRGACVPVHRLHRLFDIAGSQTDSTKALLVMVQDGDRRCGLMVDELLGQEQVVIKSLGAGLEKLHGIHGGAILGDGNVSLILDIAGVMDMAVAA